MIKKVLVMNCVCEGKVQTKGLLSLESSNKLCGKLKLFNIEGDCNLFLKIGDKNLLFENIENTEDYSFDTIFHSLDLPVCSIVTDGKEILAYGKTESFKGDYQSLLDEFKKLDKRENVIELNDGLGEEVEIPYELKIQSQSKSRSTAEQIEDADNFFEMVKPQVDALFSKSEHFSKLEEEMENTEWVKVPYISETSDHYIIGKIFENNNVAFLCYGIPSESRDEKAPENLSKYCQWLPLDFNAQDGRGYWVMYQDAKTGENVEM